jgi:hypothetical protein
MFILVKLLLLASKVFKFEQPETFSVDKPQPLQDIVFSVVLFVKLKEEAIAELPLKLIVLKFVPVVLKLVIVVLSKYNDIVFGLLDKSKDDNEEFDIVKVVKLLKLDIFSIDNL